MYMMMESMGPLVFGYHLDVVLMVASGIFYIICALALWKKAVISRNELINALFAFLVYQAVNMLAMGLEMQTMNMLFGEIAAFAILLGSVYMLKFPFSSCSQGTRRAVFLVSLIAVLGIFVWFMQNEMYRMELGSFVLWYDIVVNGIVVGGFMILLAFRTREKTLRLKALGGGTGVVSCCVVSNAAMIAGSVVTGTVFGFLAPILILGSLLNSETRAK